MALTLIRAIIAAANLDLDEMTVLLVHGEPKAVTAPYGHERRPGAAAEIAFDQTAPTEARLVLKDTWGGSIRMSIAEFRQLAREGVSSRFETAAQIADSWPEVRRHHSGPSGQHDDVVSDRRRVPATTPGRLGHHTSDGATSFRCAACGEMAAVVRAVPAGFPADMGPPLGRQAQSRDGIVVDYFGGTAWKLADARNYQAVNEILSSEAPDPASLRRIDWELALFYCPDCEHDYCRAHWRSLVLGDDGVYDCTMGRCPRGHEHILDD
jgi:hypothetical protein